MRRHYSEIDSKTGRTLVLSDASYNMAMEWLQNEQGAHNRDIFRCENCGTDNMQIYTGECTDGINPRTGEWDVWYKNIVMFYYDESRGYLMQE